MKKTKSKSKASVKGAGKPATGKKQCGRVAKRGTDKAAQTGRKSLPAKRSEGKKIFEGATEISMTENKIAVTRSVKKNASGSYAASTTREYHDMTAANMRAFNEVMRERGAKKITVKLR